MTQERKHKKREKQKTSATSKKARDKKKDEDQVLNGRADKKIGLFKRLGLAVKEVSEHEAHMKKVEAAKKKFTTGESAAEQDIAGQKLWEAVYPELKTKSK